MPVVAISVWPALSLRMAKMHLTAVHSISNETLSRSAIAAQSVGFVQPL
jgi:hypothetical protein